MSHDHLRVLLRLRRIICHPYGLDTNRAVFLLRFVEDALPNGCWTANTGLPSEAD